MLFMFDRHKQMQVVGSMAQIAPQPVEKTDPTSASSVMNIDKQGRADWASMFLESAARESCAPLP